jgi:hypothetical protein
MNEYYLMFEQSVSVTQKKRRCLAKKGGVEFTKGSIRQISYWRYSKSKIDALELGV